MTVNLRNTSFLKLKSEGRMARMFASISVSLLPDFAFYLENNFASCSAE